MIDDLEIVKLTLEDLDYIWEHAREHDIEEFKIQGVDNTNYRKLLNNKNSYVAKYKGKPALAFGYVYGHYTMWFSLIATEEVNKKKKMFFAVSKIIFNYYARNNMEYKILVQVWDKHTESLNWLEHLGFEYTGVYKGKEDKRSLIMEKK